MIFFNVHVESIQHIASNYGESIILKELPVNVSIFQNLFTLAQKLASIVNI